MPDVSVALLRALHLYADSRSHSTTCYATAYSSSAACDCGRDALTGVLAAMIAEAERETAGGGSTRSADTRVDPIERMDSAHPRGDVAPVPPSLPFAEVCRAAAAMMPEACMAEAQRTRVCERCEQTITALRALAAICDDAVHWITGDATLSGREIAATLAAGYQPKEEL
jgi:hypothetical protein